MLSDAPVTATMPAVDLDRAKDFYENKLGLKLKPSHEEGGLTFECGNGTTIYLYKRGPSKADHTAASFHVKDLAAEMTDLRAKGVVFEEYDFPGLKTVDGVASGEGYKAAWFKDTEGNILSIGEMA